MKNTPSLRRIVHRGSRTAARLAALVLIPLFLTGCTTDGQVREVDGAYRKVYPDKKNGGWYYTDHNAQKVHLDELPPEGGLMPSEHDSGGGSGGSWD
jgi:hypothetical protein